MAAGRRIRVVMILVVLGAAAAGAWWWHRQGGPGAASALTLYGNVDLREVQLAFNVPERITALHVAEGDHVEPGELLAEIDATRYQAELARARARAEAQAQVVARLEAGSRKEDIADARARLAEAEAEVHEAERTFARIDALVRRGVASEQQRDDARAALDTARGRLGVARAHLDLVLAGPRKEDIAAARATLEALRHDVVLAEKALADTRLYAPVAGVIRNRVLEVGDLASPERPVFTLALTEPVWVRAYVPETALGKVAPGARAEVLTDSFPGRRFSGWIGYISPTAEFTPKQVQTPELRTRLVYELRVYACNPDGALRLGMPATVEVPLDPASGRALPSDLEPCGG